MRGQPKNNRQAMIVCVCVCVDGGGAQNQAPGASKGQKSVVPCVLLH